jgi:hypothetical protein
MAPSKSGMHLFDIQVVASGKAENVPAVGLVSVKGISVVIGHESSECKCLASFADIPFSCCLFRERYTAPARPTTHIQLPPPIEYLPRSYPVH